MGIFSKIKILFYSISLILVAYVLGFFKFTCPFIILSGFKCSMCDSTKAVLSFLDGRLIDGILLNPLAPYFCLLLLICYLHFFETAFKTNKISIELLNKWMSVMTDSRVIYVILPLNFIYLNFLK